MAGERDGGLKVKRAGFQGPGGERGEEARGFERVLLVAGVVLVVESREREIGGGEAQRVVLGAEVEDVVGMRLSLFHDPAARRALRY